MTDLRPYQTECLRSVKTAYLTGLRRVLVSLPTGTGKTVVFASFPEFFKMQKRMLVLAHREELLDQARKKFRERAPNFKVGIEQGDRQAADNCDVVIASVPTLGRAGSARLQRLDPSAFYLIVVDEAHHAVAESYKRVLQHFRVFEEGSPRLLVGFTATPKRGDGKALGEIFQDIAFTRGLEEMIRQRYLSSIVGWRVRTEVGLDNVKIVGGDFSESQLARAVNTTERNEIVLKAYWQKARDRQCIVFCVDVQHSKDIADRFSRAGIRTAAVWGDMPCDERKDALKKFASGKIKVLTNCNVLTEGFDEPSVSCVLLARPTKSLLLYAQMVGRGTRLHPGKTDVCVIDIVDNSEAHTLAGLNRLFELPDSMDLRGHDVLKTLQRVREIGHRYPWVDVNGVSKAGDLEFVMERVDLFRCEPPPEVAAISEFVWMPLPGEGYRLLLSEKRQFVAARNLLGRWELRFIAGREEPATLAVSDELAKVVRHAERWVEENAPDSVKLVRRDAQWRDKAATDAQLELLRRWRVPVPDGLSRGQAAWILSVADARRGTKFIGEGHERSVRQAQ